MIRYCQYNEIDKTKWDECIAGSSLCLPYAYSWYLDIVSPGWDGLISDNYEGVMPLPFKQKWFVTYIYKPYFAQQLGIFAHEDPKENVLNEFIKSIPKKFSYTHTNLNESNPAANKFTAVVNVNHLIQIDRTHTSIYKDYSRNCRRNIKKAVDGGLVLRNDLDIPTFVTFIFENLEKQISRLDPEQGIMLEKIISTARKKIKGELIGVYAGQDELCAAGFFMQTKDRHIFSVCASTDKGKQYNAMYLLVDEQIKKSAGIKKWFDFSGSNISGIAYFNQSFGARVMTYPTLHLNRLPFPLRLLKK
jgi:hypothetical protein